MHPKIWGRSGWHFMHCITLDYPKAPTVSEQNQMKRFFMGVKDVIPCTNCKVNFNKHMKTYPLTIPVLSSRKTLVQWLIRIHNLANKETGAAQLTDEQVLSRFKMKVVDL